MARPSGRHPRAVDRGRGFAPRQSVQGRLRCLILLSRSIRTDIRPPSLRGPKIFATVLALLLAAIWIGPLALNGGHVDQAHKEFLNGPFALPIAPTLEPYVKVWQGLHFGVLMQNSLLYAVLGSALAVGLALVPAFALSRFEPPGKRYIFALLLTGLMLPQQTVLIPLYDMLRWLHLFDTRIGLIIVHGVYGMPPRS